MARMVSTPEERAADRKSHDEWLNKDGGPAFPIEVGAWPGMTLRDYFAGQALAGVLAAPGRHGEEARGNPDRAVAWAYEMAVAMLAAHVAPSPTEGGPQ